MVDLVTVSVNLIASNEILSPGIQKNEAQLGQFDCFFIISLVVEDLKADRSMFLSNNDKKTSHHVLPTQLTIYIYLKIRMWWSSRFLIHDAVDEGEYLILYEEI